MHHANQIYHVISDEKITPLLHCTIMFCTLKYSQTSFKFSSDPKKPQARTGDTYCATT